MSHLFSRRYGLLVVLILLIVAIPLTVSANIGATVGSPTLNSPNVQWIVTTTQMTGQDHYICMWYQPAGGSAATQSCSCAGGGSCDKYVGQWTCSVPAAGLAGKSVQWQARTYQTAACGTQTNPIGTITTQNFGPNAVTLGAFSAQGLPAPFGLILPVAGLVVIGGVALRRSRRS
jgi:hypothetical protein